MPKPNAGLAAMEAQLSGKVKPPKKPKKQGMNYGANTP